MNSGHFRMPGGGYSRKKPDPLQLLMERHQQSPHDSFLPATSKASSGRFEQVQYNTTTFNAQKVAGQRATVFGGGSVGSHLLNFMGPNLLKVNVADCKRVETKHLHTGRTAYGTADVGLRKVDALKRMLERRFPGTQITAFPYDVAELPDSKIKAMLSESKVAVLAIDDPRQILRISDIAYPIVPLIQVAMHRQAESGHIAVSTPLQTPCLRCTLDIRGEEQIYRLASEAANSHDIVAVAQQAARMAVDIIHSAVTAKPITRWDTSKNLIYIANVKQEFSPDGPGLHHEGSTRQPGCPICSNNTNPY
jgi:molybdopterin/thiamine biosynthesis adenylyltransferase